MYQFFTDVQNTACILYGDFMRTRKPILRTYILEYKDGRKIFEELLKIHFTINPEISIFLQNL